MAGSGEAICREVAQAWRAVDQDGVVAIGHLLERSAEALWLALLAGLQAVGGRHEMDQWAPIGFDNGRVGVGFGQHLGGRDVDLGWIYAQRPCARRLGIKVDHQDAVASCRSCRGKTEGDCGFTHATFLIEKCNDSTHGQMMSCQQRDYRGVCAHLVRQVGSGGRLARGAHPLRVE